MQVSSGLHEKIPFSHESGSHSEWGKQGMLLKATNFYLCQAVRSRPGVHKAVIYYSCKLHVARAAVSSPGACGWTAVAGKGKAQGAYSPSPQGTVSPSRSVCPMYTATQTAARPLPWPPSITSPRDISSKTCKATTCSSRDRLAFLNHLSTWGRRKTTMLGK